MLDDLVDGVRERSDEAFTAVHQVIASDLASFANGMLRDRHAAEDAVQQAFLELARTAHRFRGDGRALVGWLYRTVRRRCLDEVRRRRRHPEVPVLVLPEPAEPDADPELVEDPLVADALGELSAKDRELIVLRHIVGLSGSEMASVTGRSRAAVYAGVERAEQRLRELLEGGVR
jgi:RNA polymerase sigma-70 factor (ECF subfamily)